MAEVKKQATLPTMNTVQIQARNVYGCTKYYIVSENAAAINALTGKKTVELRDIRALTSLGFKCVMQGTAEMPAVEAMC